jgi:hypothetical protein
MPGTSPGRLFLLRGISYPKRPKLLMHNFRHLHLSFCFYDQESPVLRSFTFPCCLFCYLTMSNLIHPQRSVLESDQCRSITSMYPIHFGGDAGLCPRVHNAFATKELQQYRYYTTHLFMCQLDPTHHHVLRTWKL